MIPLGRVRHSLWSIWIVHTDRIRLFLKNITLYDCNEDVFVGFLNDDLGLKIVALFLVIQAAYIYHSEIWILLFPIPLLYVFIFWKYIMTKDIETKVYELTIER